MSIPITTQPTANHPRGRDPTLLLPESDADAMNQLRARIRTLGQQNAALVDDNKFFKELLNQLPTVAVNNSESALSINLAIAAQFRQ